MAVWFTIEAIVFCFIINAIECMLSVWVSVICQSRSALIDFLDVSMNKILVRSFQCKGVTALPAELSMPRWQKWHKQDMSLLGPQEPLPSCFPFHSHDFNVLSTIAFETSLGHVSQASWQEPPSGTTLASHVDPPWAHFIPVTPLWMSLRVSKAQCYLSPVCVRWKIIGHCKHKDWTSPASFTRINPASKQRRKGNIQTLPGL